MLGWRAERHGAAFGLVILRNAGDEESFSREGFRFFAGAQNDMEESSAVGMLCRAIRESPLRGGAVRLGSGGAAAACGRIRGKWPVIRSGHFTWAAPRNSGVQIAPSEGLCAVAPDVVSDGLVRHQMPNGHRDRPTYPNTP